MVSICLESVATITITPNDALISFPRSRVLFDKFRADKVTFGCIDR